ncbi:MAG: bifunctional folylpolyglutamate synthase/dihydrofolate synthase [Candidatus Margulisbacteria bacterium]|nr:bifunctional folylpolyglutamate synthase/dihydrofolate synthase [Candidatus Margulisiibacteriota bacterium]
MKYLESLEKFGINLGLDRINYLLEQLDNPHLKFKSIHVAGTNGKGSTCAMIASILKEAGYKVGLYTSPHLFKYNERIKINGRDISDKEFLEGIQLIQEVAGKPATKRRGFQPPNHPSTQPPTVFEVLTALSFWYFAKKKVDYAVVEVGMGGRLDATNVITPLVSVITNVELEHTAVLGNTLAKIAVEKGAIIKPRVPAVTAESKLPVLKVLQHIAEKNRSTLVAVNVKDEKFPSGLIGAHQQLNAACALAAIKLANIKASKSEILVGLKKVSWPARFQIVTKKPLTIVDGAHNPAGTKVLIETLQNKFPGKKFSFVIGAQEDKDSPAMLEELTPVAREIIITRSSHHQARNSIAGKKAIPLRDALKMTKKRDRVIAGSLYLAADALKLLDH